MSEVTDGHNCQDLRVRSAVEPTAWAEQGVCAGLASAMYMQGGQQVPNPDSTSGLYIRKQDGTVVQVRVPTDHIAFQMGEAMQVCPLPPKWVG